MKPVALVEFPNLSYASHGEIWLQVQYEEKRNVDLEKLNKKTNGEKNMEREKKKWMDLVREMHTSSAATQNNRFFSL